MPSYIGIIHKDADSDFGVSFPDFPGCITAGRSLDEAGRMAQEALQGHIVVMREYGEAIPEPMGLEAAKDHEFAKNAVAFIVVVAGEEAGDRAVRLNITLPEKLTRRIDAQAKSLGLSRSAFLAKAATKALDDRAG